MAAPSKQKVPFFETLLVGGVAGAVGATVVFPLDMVKTRLQNQGSGGGGGADKLYRNPLHCFRTILRAEGARGFYRGLGANLVGIMPEKAIKFAVNDALGAALNPDPGGTAPLPLDRQALAGAGAGFCQVVATTPMEMVKIRLQLQATLPAARRQTAAQLVRALGLVGLYRGTLATLLRDVPYSVVFFPAYAALREALAVGGGTGDGTQGGVILPVPVPIGATLVAGAAAAALAAGVVTPCDVVKTRLQVAGARRRYPGGVRECFATMLREEGAGALFKGAGPRMAISAPLFGIALLAFELQKEYLAARGAPGGGGQQ